MLSVDDFSSRYDEKLAMSDFIPLLIGKSCRSDKGSDLPIALFKLQVGFEFGLIRVIKVYDSVMRWFAGDPVQWAVVLECILRFAIREYKGDTCLIRERSISECLRKCLPDTVFD